MCSVREDVMIDAARVMISKILQHFDKKCDCCRSIPQLCSCYTYHCSRIVSKWHSLVNNCVKITIKAPCAMGLERGNLDSLNSNDV